MTHLARLVETRQVKPSELTELYLSRLAKYDPILHCVVSLTPELARAQAKRSRRRNRRRQVSRPIARHPVRPEGPVRGARDQDDVGRLAVERPGHRHRRHRLHEAESRGRDPGREAVDRSPCRGRTVVRRPDTQPLEHQARMRRVRRPARARPRPPDLSAFSIGSDTGGSITAAGGTKRPRRPAAHVRTRQPIRRNDAGVDARHRRSAVPLGRGLRARVRRDLRPRRQGQHASSTCPSDGMPRQTSASCASATSGPHSRAQPGETRQSSSPRAGTTKRP